MQRQRVFRRTFLAMALAMMGANGLAQEAPQNYPIGNAQAVTINATVMPTAIALDASVAGYIGDNTDGLPDVDFFSFEAKAGDVLTFDASGNGVDTSLAVYGVWPEFTILAENLDRAPDQGMYDPLIVQFRVPADGVYTVGITATPIEMDNGGAWTDPWGMGTFSSGSYSIAISGSRVLPPPPTGGGSGGGAGGGSGGGSGSEPTHITIDIKPGDRKRTSIVSMKRDYVPVALLSSKGPDEFKPLEVDQKTITFGVNGNEPSMKHCVSHRGLDLNKDRIPDLVCLFDMDAAGFQVGDVEGVLKGKTKGSNGVEFVGRGMLKVVHAKKGHQRHEGRDRGNDRRDGRRGRDRD